MYCSSVICTEWFTFVQVYALTDDCSKKWKNILIVSDMCGGQESKERCIDSRGRPKCKSGEKKEGRYMG